MDRAALEKVLLALKVLHSSREPMGNITDEDIRRLRGVDHLDSGLSNSEIALMAIRREVKRQEDALASADELVSGEWSKNLIPVNVTPRLTAARRQQTSSGRTVTLRGWDIDQCGS